jgi:eukaryotic-like serine/threonine-protein kinase
MGRHASVPMAILGPAQLTLRSAFATVQSARETAVLSMSELDLPPLVGGKYQPLRLIGKGGMGAVYEVEHLHTGQRLALKLLTPSPGATVERFKREARAASRISSDHIVRVTDADISTELGGAPFLVMELLEGEDLERVTGNRPAAPADVLEWLRQVALGLGKAHECGIVHRDLKPENLFLTRRDDGSPLVKILDFGIAKVVAEGAALTQSDQFLGTPMYMAPEQADGQTDSPITPRTDLYALGLIAFKLLTGHFYWKTGSLAQILSQVLSQRMLPASERGSTFGAAFDAWFARSCDRDPSRRFASAREQVEALAAALGQPLERRGVDRGPVDRAPIAVPTLASAVLGSAPTLNASSTDLTTRRDRVHRRRWIAGGVVGAVGLGVFAILARSGARHEETTVRTPAIETTLSANAPPPPKPLASTTPSSPGGVPVESVAPATDAGPASTGIAPSAAIPRTPGAPSARAKPVSARASAVDASKPLNPFDGQY